MTLGLTGVSVMLYRQPSQVQADQVKSMNDQFLAYVTKYGKSYATGQEFEGRRENFEKSFKAAGAKT